MVLAAIGVFSCGYMAYTLFFGDAYFLWSDCGFGKGN